MGKEKEVSSFNYHLKAITRALEEAEPRDPRWDELTSFIEQLPELMEKRKNQLLLLEAMEKLEARQREVLQEALERLQALPEEWLTFFDIGHVRQWQSGQIAEDDLTEAAERADSLHAVIESYQEIHERSQHSIVAKREARPELERLEAEFDKIRTALEAIVDRGKENWDEGGAVGSHSDLETGDDDDATELEEDPAITYLKDIAQGALEGAVEKQKARAAEKQLDHVEPAPSGAEEVVTATTAKATDTEVAEEASSAGDETVLESTPPVSEATVVEEVEQLIDEPEPVAREETIVEEGVVPAVDGETADVAVTAENKAKEPVQAADGQADGQAATVISPVQNGETESAVEVVGEPVESAAAAVEDAALPAETETEETPETDAKEDAKSHEWDEFFWQLVGEGDLSAAYWLSRSLEVQAEPIETPLPSWLLSAVQGAWWLPSTRGALVNDLSAIPFEHILGEQLNQQLTGMAAGLLPALLAPGTHLGTWITTDPRLPAPFNQVVEAIQAFHHHAQPIYRDDILVIRGEDRRHETIKRLAQEANRWLEEAPLRKTKLARANNVWINWTRPGGPLREMIEIVAGNNPKNAGQLKNAIAEWRATNTQDRLDRTDADLLGTNQHKVRSIIGSPRDRLLTQSEEAVELAEEWLATVTSAADQSGWRLSQVEKLVDAIEKVKDAAAKELALAEKTASGQIAPAVVRLLRWAFRDVCQLLEVQVPDTELPPRRQHAFPRGIVPGLQAGLAFRLYYLADSELPDAFLQPWPELAEVAQALVKTKTWTLQDAFALWVKCEDYRFTPVLLQNMPDDADTEQLLQQHQQVQSRSQTILDAQLQTTQDAVEQAMVDGVLSDVEHSQLNGELQSVDKHKQSQNYRRLQAKLSAIQQRLDQHRRDHLAHQRERWELIAQRLGHNNVDPETQEQIAEFMKYVLEERRDIIVVDERLARLEELLDTGVLPPVDEFEVQAERDVYREFTAALSRWENQAHQIVLSRIARKLRRSSYDNILAFNDQLPRPRELEVAEAFDNWSNLKSTPLGHRREVTEKIATILRYLGFTFHVPATSAFEWKENSKDWVYLSAAVTAGNLSPVPQFGSSQPETFAVLCLWERPGAEVIGSHLHNLKLSFNNVIVLYLGRLMTRHRINLMHYAREQGLSLAVLDELLLLYLAGERESRLRTFLRCALPLASVNPYMETGPVPPEMFFGRVSERKSIQQPTGYAMVYGGRQLGKSALLQQAEREFHSPDNDRYVLREDIKSIGDPLGNQDNPELIWQRLRAGLENIGLLDRTVATSPKTIIRQVREMMEDHSQRRVLVLFDEADNFLAADIKSNFEIVSQLKTLMDDTQRRFKVVFAGLHNVQRYEGIPNQPLAHLPRLAVGPLEPPSAQQLIRQPLEALGFRFPEGDETPVLSILAYTNYHPGLIQLFCQKLLQMMYQKMPRDLGPFLITRDDVEAVYRQRDVQDDIRRRFEWTLALDPRYKALTQMIVLDQIQDRDGYSKTYSLEDLLSLGRAFWSQAFENSTRDEFRGYLDEMVGLGVLVRNERDEYRLRSPNLVRLMGKEEDIYGGLQEVTSRAIPATLEPDSHHAPLDKKGHRYSPFTYKQSRVLNTKRHGVGLIFGSNALGIDLAATAIKTHFVPEGSSGRVFQVRVASPSADAFTRRLKQIVDDNESMERLVAYHIVQDLPEAIAQQVEAALAFCQRLRRQRQWVRILFIFDSVATRGWTSLPRERRESLEDQVDVAAALRRWDEIGVTQRLKQQDKIDSERAVNSIMETLHGWPILLDQLAEQWGGNDDVLPACASLKTELEDVDSSLVERFLMACGWAIDEKVQQVLKMIGQEEIFPEEMLVPAFLGENLTKDECEAVIHYLHRTELIQRKETNVVVEPLVKRLMLAQ